MTVVTFEYRKNNKLINGDDGNDDGHDGISLYIKKIKFYDRSIIKLILKCDI